MGMAASQARYLALTARKTNTEWEGQQINQARTALANQSANLFNQLLGLEVPNPPKSTDYTEVQYSYSDGDNESVLESWHQLSNSDKNYNYEVKHYYYADIFTGAQKMLQNPEVHVGDVLKEMKFNNSTADISYDQDGVTVKYNVQGKETELKYAKVDDEAYTKEGFTKAATDFATAKNMAMKDGKIDSDVVYYRQDGDGTWHFFLANTQSTEYTRITQAMVDSDNNLKKYLSVNGYLDVDGQLKENDIFGNKTTEGDKEVWSFIKDDSPGSTVTKYTGSAIDNTDYSMAYNAPAYVGNAKLTELNELISNNQIDQVADLAQILRDCPDSNMNKHLKFDASGNLIYDGNGIYTFEMYGKTYYTTQEDLDTSIGHPYDPNKPIELQEKLAYYNAAYIQKKIEETNHALLETDSNGRFTSVKFDNDTVTYNLNVETVTNEAAYQDAMNRYYYKKQQYEKTIADINAKTEVIQQEDRTLELRLKQLDTEQKALATEMEAVQKVIKDNVEKTFKTFSD